jgi:hypothetical protein
MSKEINLSMLASLVGSDRKKGMTDYKIINKYVGPLPQVIQIVKEDK